MKRTGILDLLGVKQIDDSVFQSEASCVIYAEMIFGGQILAQSLLSAQKTIGSRPIHSLHAYFLRAGNDQSPIRYDVEKIRDGRTLSSRSVRASQMDKTIFQMMASFHEPETGLDYQKSSDADFASKVKFMASLKSEDVQSRSNFPIEDLFNADNVDFLYLGDSPFTVEDQQNNQLSYWFRITAPLPSDIAMHHAAIAFVCDMGLTTACLRPHSVSLFSQGLQLASLDHSMWFHSDDFNANEWMCYCMETTRSKGSRAYATGKVYSQQGQHIATVSQEALMRVRNVD